MRWTKLNTTFDADPNSPEPRTSVDSSVVTVRFFLNWFIWGNVQEGDEATLVFRDALMYRLGSTNDEGFYLGQCRFSRTGIRWGDFYELQNTNWKYAFPADKIVVDASLADSPDLRHYLFYFRDETFECIAREFEYGRLSEGSP